MVDQERGYMELEENYILSQSAKHQRLIYKFIINNGYSIDDLAIDERIIGTIICKVDERKQYFHYFHALDMSDFKEVALNCFWYIKLHPLSLRTQDAPEDKQEVFSAINEKFAVYFLIHELRSLLRKEGLGEECLNRLNGDYVKELVYTFKYRDVSKEAMIMLVETMAILVGLNPYKPDDNK